MEILMPIWEFFQNNILTKPQFFIGFIVFAGYALLRKPIYECLAGFIKAVVGYMILNVASGGLVGNFRPVLAGLKDRFDLSAAVIDPYFGQTAAQMSVENIGRSFSMMMMVLLIAFTMNILLVLFRRYTKIRTLFITGHIMVQQSSTALWLVLFCFPDLQDPGVVLMLGVLLGTYWAVASNLTVEPVAKLTEGGGFATGHQQMFAIYFTSKIAKKIGNPKKSLENLKLPGFLSIFNENVVATGILIFIFFGCIITILGLVVFHSPILVISGFVPLFFDNATLAVFANRLGGIRAAAIIPFCCGILQVLGGGFAAYYFTTGNFGGWHGNIDWDTVWPVIGLIMQNFQYVGVAFVVIALLAIPQIIYQRHKDTYFLIAEDYDQYKEVLAKKQGVPVDQVVVDCRPEEPPVRSGNDGEDPGGRPQIIPHPKPETHNGRQGCCAEKQQPCSF